jgi:hypothetical protein
VSVSMPDITRYLVCRLVERYPKPIMIAAGNSGPGFSTVEDLKYETGPTLPPNCAIRVGAAMTGERRRANFDLPQRDSVTLTSYSSRGPGFGGEAMPDIVTPSGAFAAEPLTSYPKDARARARRAPYELPPGYTIGGGTSQATPFASGAVALLISAAKQSNVPFDIARIRAALVGGARPIPGMPVSDQGAGVVDVEGAWEALRAMPRTALPVIDVSVPVEAAWSAKLPLQRGVGLLLYEGWAAGDTGTRVIEITRRGGEQRSIPLRIRWRGNDGTFSTTKEKVVLERNQPASIPVLVAPKSSGLHSAWLELVTESGTIVKSISATTVATIPIGEDTTQLEASLIPDESQRWFVKVPAGARSLSITLASDGPMTLRVCNPNLRDQFGHHIDGAYYLVGTDVGPGTHTLENPMSGTWELVVLNNPNNIPHPRTEASVAPRSVSVSISVAR